MTSGFTFAAATLLVFGTATDLAPDPRLAASTTIFVDGTKSLTGNEEGISPYRMADSFNGVYAQSDAAHNLFFDYPRSVGPITGLTDPTYDVSEADATAKTVAAVRQAMADYEPGDVIYVVGYSQGAGAVVNAIPALETPEFAGLDIQYVLAANPRRDDGGILTRFPAGVYLPIFGVTFGGGTSPRDQNTKVLQVTKQYDGIADAPTYVFNLVADLNAVMGYVYLHPGYYRTVDPQDPTAIRTTSADGRITDVLIPAKVGELPLTMPLLQLGVPRSFVEALDPFLRAVVETGYDRPATATSSPSQPVGFQLGPPPQRWASDAQAVSAGAVRTLQALTGTTPPSVPTAKELAAPTSSTGEPPDAGTDASASKPLSRPNKVEPPRQPKGGWKPGDLLRSSSDPTPAVSGSAPNDEPTTAPEPASAPHHDEGEPAGAEPRSDASSTPKPDA